MILSAVKFESLKGEMIEQARHEYGTVEPCINRPSLDQCFTIEGNKLVFWFNEPTRSTRVITREISVLE